jgi:hypothetical protein
MGFGPEKNLSISYPLSTLVTIGIPAGKQVVFNFSNKAGTAESAFIIYRKIGPNPADLELVHEAGSPPNRGWDDFRLTVSGDYLLTAWAKVRFWARDALNDLYVKSFNWSQSAVEQRPPTPPYFLRFVCDDKGNHALYTPDDAWNNGHDWSWDDVTGWASLIDL